VLVPVKLKQYNVPTDKSLEGKVTVWLETAVAVPMPLHAEDPEGRFVVVTVQLEAVPLTVNPEGNVTWTLASVAAVLGLAQTVPPVVVEAFKRSSLTYAS
jgi:hypothetical protein